jgi:tetratricopeptide (TPR) repeat protein
LGEIEAIANLVPLPKNEHWYTGVAWIMMEANEPAHTRKAIEYFNKARSVASGAWVAFEGLAICHGNLGFYYEAVDLMNEAIQLLPQTADYLGIDFHLRSKMGTWQRELGDVNAALQVTPQAYEGSLEFPYPSQSASDHHILLAIRNYFLAMYDMYKFEDIIHFLHDLDARTTSDEGRSMWIVFLRAQSEDMYDVDLLSKLGVMRRSLDSNLIVPLMRTSTERAVPLQSKIFSNSGNLLLTIQCITWLYEVLSEQEYAAELCQKAISLIDESDATTQQDSWWCRDKIAAILSAYYLKTAIALKEKGGDFASTVTMLDTLAYHRQGGKKYVRASDPALFMGEWLHDYANAEDKVWMMYFKPSVTRALHLLSDNDPWND